MSSFFKGVASFLLVLLQAQATDATASCASQPALSLPSNLTNETATNGYYQWVLEKGDTAPYAGVQYLPLTSNPCKGMALHWNIVNDTFQVAFAVEATGWASFGMSETGGMRGADLVYYQVMTNELTDAYVTDGYVKPTPDTSQDWELGGVTKTDDGFLIVEASRALDTGDAVHDRKIVDDSGIYTPDHIVIGAWGNNEMMYHLENRLSSTLQLFPGGDGMETALNVFRKDMEARAEGAATFKLDGYEIPVVETTYLDLCFTNSDLVEKGLLKNSSDSTYIIGFEFVIDNDTAPYVHHITVNGVPSSFSSGDDCDEAFVTFMAWAPGADFYHFPDGGLQMGNVANSINAFSIQYHFDNPNGHENLVDDASGVIIYYSNAPVEHDIGMFLIGDPRVELSGRPIGDGKTKHDFTCPATCLESLMADDEITIIDEALHMHQVGKRMTNGLVRNGSTVNEGIVDYYDFDQRGIARVQQNPYAMKKGDSFVTTCYYESQDDAEFGLGSSDEMCITFYYYYPKQENLFFCGPDAYNAFCSAEYESTTLGQASNFDRGFEGTSTVDGFRRSNPLPVALFISIFGLIFI